MDTSVVIGRTGTAVVTVPASPIPVPPIHPAKQPQPPGTGLCRLSKWTKQPVSAELTQLAQKARFSNHTLTAPELARMQGALRLTEAAVSHLPFPKRFVAKWLFARY